VRCPGARPSDRRERTILYPPPFICTESPFRTGAVAPLQPGHAVRLLVLEPSPHGLLAVVTHPLPCLNLTAGARFVCWKMSIVKEVSAHPGPGWALFLCLGGRFALSSPLRRGLQISGFGYRLGPGSALSAHRSPHLGCPFGLIQRGADERSDSRSNRSRQGRNRLPAQPLRENLRNSLRPCGPSLRQRRFLIAPILLRSSRRFLQGRWSQALSVKRRGPE
jgi:hypothetical protein